jgi:hypothetical protein
LEDANLLERWWRSRIGGRLLLELSLLVIGFMAYKWVRLLVRDQVLDAFNNAEVIISVERAIGIFNEHRLQDLVLQWPDLMWWVNRYYAHMHFWVTGVALVVLYIRRPDRYLWLRRMLVAISAAGLLMHAMFPLAPPRMQWRLGFVDTLARWGPSVYADSTVAEVANQYAAMPSLHVGYAVLVAMAVMPIIPGRWRYVLLVHPAVTIFAVVVTANHYWLDAIVVIGMIVIAERSLFHRPSPADRLAPLPARVRLDGRPADALTTRV